MNRFYQFVPGKLLQAMNCLPPTVRSDMGLLLHFEIDRLTAEVIMAPVFVTGTTGWGRYREEPQNDRHPYYCACQECERAESHSFATAYMRRDV